jgi:hypothetical protein|tara:strand:+ start:672 stop:1040 length:369 start_codon:yes stop_codon:yes gene_type:complete
MTTNVEDIYKRYPEVKEEVDQNTKFWSDPETYDPNEQSCFDCWTRVHDSRTELYNFLYALSDYDGFLLKNNEITPEDYMRSEAVIKKTMTDNLGVDLDEIWWVSDDHELRIWAEFHKRDENE